MKHQARLRRLLNQLGPAQRAARLSATAADGAASRLLWNSMPEADREELTGHIDFANRVVHVLAAQEHVISAQLNSLQALQFALEAFAAWGAERYLSAGADGDDPTMVGPSHPSLVFGTPDPRLDAVTGSHWDALVRDAALELRSGIISVAARLVACEDTAAALSAAGPFRWFIDSLIDGAFARCRDALETLIVETAEYTGPVPMPAADPELLRWLSRIFSAELKGKWPAPRPEVSRRIVTTLTTYEEQQEREAALRRELEE